MRLDALLRHLDQVLVPRLARAFARIGRGRVRPRVFTAVALTASAAVLVGAVWLTRERPAERREAAGGEIVHVGVASGQSIQTYVSDSRSKLDTLLERQRPASTRAPETYALVTLKAYLAPERLTPVLGGVAVAEVYARLPLAQAATQTVRIPAFRIPDDVISGMAQVAGRKEAEADQLRLLAAKLQPGADGEAELRNEYVVSANLAGVEADAFRAGCTCVYAAVVRATPGALDEIAGRPEVRAVEPAPEVVRLDRAVFLPPLPEQAAPPTPADIPSEYPTPVPATSPSIPAPPTAPPAPTAPAPPASAHPASPSHSPAPSPAA